MVDDALPGEPTFTLLARDWSAAHTVRAWAYERERMILRGDKPQSDMEKVENARRIADAMVKWYAANITTAPWRHDLESAYDRPLQDAFREPTE